MTDIHWYPGHMAKTRRMLLEQLRRVDAVIELCDARAPRSTRNPDLDRMMQGKPRVLVLNKADMANQDLTGAWLTYFRARGMDALRFTSTSGKVREILAPIERATRPVVERMRARGAVKTVRLMVIGIPNVGKSTFINRIHGGAVARAGDRPGVTRAQQWVKVGEYLELMDTPGMLWPKLEDQRAARTLAFLGSVRDEVTDTEALSGALIQELLRIDPEAARARFKLKEATGDEHPLELLELACRGRGWLLSGARPDLTRASALVLDEFRAGKVGRITLERPGDDWTVDGKSEGSIPGSRRPEDGKRKSGTPRSGRPGDGRQEGGRPRSGRPGDGKPEDGMPRSRSAVQGKPGDDESMDRLIEDSTPSENGQVDTLDNTPPGGAAE